jgi:hypothetical protein
VGLTAGGQQFQLWEKVEESQLQLQLLCQDRHQQKQVSILLPFGQDLLPVFFLLPHAIAALFLTKYRTNFDFFIKH